MDSQYQVPQSPSQINASHVKHHHPYFTPTEVEQLSEKQRGKQSMNQEKVRQQACGFLEAVGAKIGFPRKTIATAQNLYHRFHLFFPRKDFNYYDVTLACLYVSTKMHDTLKKPRDILMVAYAVRFPELAARSKAIGGEVEMDPAAVEQDRQRLLAIERLVLETVCFNFTVKMPFPYVIKIGRALKATKKLTRFAWRLAVDSNRTLVPLQFPPHVIAVTCIYLAALLSSFEQPPSPEEPGFRSSEDIIKLLGNKGGWETTYQACLEDLEEISHLLLDLLIQAAQNPSANTSPSTPSSPSPHPSPRNQHLSSQAMPIFIPYKPEQLIRLKIHMREKEHPPRSRVASGNGDASDILAKGDSSGFGKNEGTVRFMFGPARVSEK
ncbi:cyclin-like protein [Rickenella mellea]|uniref:Cyclin-like protein n=1 Tax=Rickenella mellea TaxID=50990 RepID=A0A4Y7Q7J2_9AGAM|nr:cyclin-like protein [Rickenella mellea]